MVLKVPKLFKTCLNNPLYITRCCASGLNLWEDELCSEIKHKIEKHWKNEIYVKNFDENDKSKKKYYVLSMFPYPSGFLHMGHVRVYTISDTIARYQRMCGKNVIHPIGWDAFGLPAENAAIDHKISPDQWTKQNISYMKKQLEQLGCTFEWSRELTTCEPEYYKWTQDLFLKLFENGLVYQREAMVNWDPVDQTVLADEQVDAKGCSWRSGAEVQKKILRQWFISTTNFAKDLLDGLDDQVLEDWKDIIKLQRHWIGDCDGVKFEFKIVNSDQSLMLWTAKPEYIEDVKFVALSEDHLIAKKSNISCKHGTVKLDTEVENPFTKQKIPVFVTSDIEFLPLTDTYLGIPAICEQDANFANSHNIPYQNITEITNENQLRIKQQAICEKAKQLNVGGYWVSAKLRDWLISRQRYWGTPIPIIHCQKCGAQPVSKKNLPVVLPKLSKLSDKSGTALIELLDWINTTCPKCGESAKRETDTMDTFVDSSWYFLRYIDPKNTREMFSTEKAKHMTPVDLYIGGKEHAVLHLYYARFVSHFLHSLGLLPEREPFKRLLVQGMVMGRSYRVKGTGQYLPENKVKILDLKKNKAETKDSGQPVVISWEKMSKSKYNGVDPDEIFEQYGTDTTRLLILADVSPTSHRNWNSNTFPGILSWQKRLWLTVRDFLRHRNNPPPVIPEEQFKSHEDYLFDSRNFYVKGTSLNYLITQQLSIAVSKQQGLTNSIRKSPPAVYAHSLQFERALAVQIIMLAPMAPYFASELWSGFTSASNKLNNSGEILWDKSVFDQTWPETDLDYNLELVCQVNNCQTVAVKIPRKELDVLTKEKAFAIGLQQKEIHDKLISWKVINSTFILHNGLEGVINFITEKKQGEKLEVAHG